MAKIKTKVVELKYIFIDGEGRNQERDKTKPARMQYTASAVMKKDGPEHKALLAEIDAEWKAYKDKFSVKGLPDTNGIKDEMMKDPSGAVDPKTEEVAKVSTGNVVAQFKTNTKWPDGNPQIVKVFDHKGTDITSAVHAADWSIGSGSTGIIHGSAQGNNVGGNHKVTLYLSAVQIARLTKYTGDNVETEEINGDDIDLGDSVGAIADGPAL
jgi:hypothetical protein